MMVESVRKDIECAFGILKSQWLFLKNWNNLSRHRNFLNEIVAELNKVNGGIEFNHLLIIMTNFVKDVTRSKLAR